MTVSEAMLIQSTIKTKNFLNSNIKENVNLFILDYAYAQMLVSGQSS